MKRIFSFICLLLSFFIFTACEDTDASLKSVSKYLSGIDHNIADTPDTTKAALSKDDIQTRMFYSDAWGKNPEGSVRLLQDTTILISIFVDDAESAWDAASMQAVREKLGVATDFISTQAALYDVQASFIYDFEQEPTLFLKKTYKDAISYDGQDFWNVNQTIDEWITQDVHSKALLNQFGAKNIGYLVFFNKPGLCYSNVYYMNYEDSLYQEKSILFAQSYQTEKEESAATYAHEILHLFGAVDLYKMNYDDGITGELITHVKTTYPNEIMFATSGTAQQITQKITPITAYFLGWIEELAELEAYPTLSRRLAGCFYFRDKAYYKDLLSEKEIDDFYFSHKHQSSLH